jgi:hypothetical protein
MKLWILDRDDCGWDELCSIVIRARDEKSARIVASTYAGDEKEDVWLNSSTSKCKPLTITGKPGLILMDFRSA